MTDTAPTPGLRQHVERRADGLKLLRRPWEPGWRETSNYTQRWQTRHVLQMGPNPGQRRESGHHGGRANNRLFNGTALRSMRTLKNGMSSGMSSPSQPWFKLAPANPDLRGYQSVKEWIDDTQHRLYAFLAKTNIYTAMQLGYGENGHFGVEAGLMVRDWEYGAAVYPLTCGEFWIAQDRALRADTLMRDATMTVAQLYDTFPDESRFSQATKNLKAQNKLDAAVPVMHLVEPNKDRVYGRVDKANKAYRSIYWEPGNDKLADVLSLGGFDQKPFWAARWDIQGMDPYATSPGFDVLPESRKVQLQELRLQGSMDYVVTPALLMPVGDRNQQANMIPRGITYTSAADMGQAARPVWQVDSMAIPRIAEDIGRTERAIVETSYAELFMAITQMQGVQPRTVEEIVRRHEEQLAQLGPVVDRVQVEKLSVVVLQAFQIMSSAQLLLPVPEELDGEPLNIEFIGVLSQAQQMMGLGKVERGLAFVGNMAGLFPQVLDVIDEDDVVRNYFDALGMPAKSSRSPEEVAEVRQARAQQQAQQQAVEAAPAMRDGAQAAELLSRIDARSPSALTSLLPQPGV